MKTAFMGVPAVLSFVAFALLVVAACTRVWISSDDGLAPGTINAISASPGTYPSHFGLWSGCMAYATNGEQAGCGYITGGCNQNLCLQINSAVLCATSRYGAIDSCGAYISARVFVILALFTQLLAMALLVTGVKYAALNSASVAALWTSVLFMSVTVGCFIAGVYKGTGMGLAGNYSVEENYSIDWGFILFGTSYGLTFVVACMTTGLLAMGSSKNHA
ncbi:hypothetical protein SARC_08518 [Sphaeroforma arctica JP610]|uniref:Uncharacterized protein n=1 Tax=Sphaeroforma arctica JP610 TaxID=667725 RepID=A0A0L0FSZ4_9EUKA|nr:hypothetical protein SARC_08518 [Sphaeroforma arctica JP610]KNC79073.1 hypothetical protein SARC_08518 [Sphaeroforma arctica JP610]|eukprot:XP_014152975.1 hypothetical protein SARC_08518 [Sphaeroforma arctica JP610]